MVKKKKIRRIIIKWINNNHTIASCLRKRQQQKSWAFIFIGMFLQCETWHYFRRFVILKMRGLSQENFHTKKKKMWTEITGSQCS